MKTRKRKEALAFWLIIAGCPLVATTEHLGYMIVLVLIILALMFDNIKEALKR